jgi:hypothetical protein
MEKGKRREDLRLRIQALATGSCGVHFEPHFHFFVLRAFTRLELTLNLPEPHTPFKPIISADL